MVHHEDTNDCTDAGGRATQGAVAESTKFFFLFVPFLRYRDCESIVKTGLKNFFQVINAFTVSLA